MRLAGTAKQYSNKAMPQETRMASPMPQPGRFRWPYQAKVITMFEPTSSSGVSRLGGMDNSKYEWDFVNSCSRCHAWRASAGLQHGCLTTRSDHGFAPGQLRRAHDRVP